MKNKFLIVVAIILSFAAGVEFTYIFLNNTNDKTTVVKDHSSNGSCSNCMSGTMIIENGGISQTVNKSIDSVVMVKNYQKNTLAGSGSGFVYKKDDNHGYIMTNYHVIDKAEEVKILFNDGNETVGKVLGGDKYIDIAVVEVPVEYVISVAHIGNSKELSLGDTVIAIGSPIGEDYFNSVTGGYVSGLDRKVTVDVEATADWIQEVIQLDAPINPGNSGGALLNINGEVVGITSIKFVNSNIEGMGFAIKIEDAMKHIDKFEKGEEVERPFLGISHVNVTDTYNLMRYGITLNKDITEGIVVLAVEVGSAADKAGLEKGDVIIQLGEDKVTNIAYLRYILYKHNAGETVELTYIRGSETKTTKVTLTERTE